MAQFSNTEEYVEYDDSETGEKQDWKEKLENFINGPYFVAVSLILIAVIAFALGRISGLQDKREPVRVINNSPPNPSLILREGSSEPSGPGEVKGVNISGQVVASKSGTKYHYPWCVGAKQISEKNKIFFDSIEEAKKAGYSPASNCKGLK